MATALIYFYGLIHVNELDALFRVAKLSILLYLS